MVMKAIARRIRQRETPFWHWVYRCAVAMRSFTLPRLGPLGNVLAAERELRHALWHWLKRQYCHQIMASRCTTLGRGVRWEGDLPLIYGHGAIHLGDHVSIGDRQTWVLGLRGHEEAILSIGAHTHVNYQTLISVAQEVRIGSHCALAGEIKIFDNNSHSTDWRGRREGRVLEPHDIAPVIIEDDVWIGTQSIILKGVRIGRGAVVAAGSVVTRDVPPLTIVAGNPARVVKELSPDEPVAARAV